MKKLLFVLIFLFPVALAGQGLDPTVKVTGEYKAQVSSEDVPKEQVFLPDSIADFDTHFDYSVFDKPYQGSYEFQPYLLDLRPRKQPLYRNQFLLNASLGYTLHPRVDAYWEPVLKDSSLNLSVYAHHRSYLGQYAATLTHSNALDGSDSHVQSVAFSKGAFESLTRAGMKGRYDMKRSYLSWGASYEGIHNGDGNAAHIKHFDNIFNRGYNKAQASLEYHSNPVKQGELFYRVALDAFYSRDNFFMGEDKPLEYLQMGKVKVYGGVGDMFVAHHGFYMDFDLQLYMLGNQISSSPAYLNTNAQYFSVTPHYLLQYEKFKVDLGANLAYVAPGKGSENFTKASQIVYPDVTITYNPWREWAIFYFKAKGGMKMNTYDDLLALNPHFHYGYRQSDQSLLDNTIENANFSLGVDGRISTRFTYELKLGYVFYGNAPMEYLKMPSSHTEPPLPGLAFTSYQSFYAGVGLSYKSESFDAQARAKYQGTYHLERDDRAIFSLPPFLVDVRLMYNWKRRIFAGISLEAQGGRQAMYKLSSPAVDRVCKIKPFYNVGLDAQYKLSNLWTVWLHVDNLLFQEIQRNLFYAQKGAEFSVGFTLNIR